MPEVLDIYTCQDFDIYVHQNIPNILIINDYFNRSTNMFYVNLSDFVLEVENQNHFDKDSSSRKTFPRIKTCYNDDIDDDYEIIYYDYYDAYYDQDEDWCIVRR